MLINFCDSRLFPKISCDKVSVDGYEVGNLISHNFSQKQKGFLGESFIKPPVTITLSFSCNIEISRVLINPCVGAQKSTGLELYSRSNQVRLGPLWENVPQKQSKEKNDYELIVSAVYSPIGKVQLSEENSVCFENRLFRPQTVDNTDQHMRSLNECCVELNGRNPRALNFVSDLNIRITRTASGRSVAIKSIEVWGQPSRAVPQLVKENINQLLIRDSYIQQQQSHEKESQPLQKKENSTTNQSHGEAVHVSEKVHLENGFEVPEDFIDAVTCEIMSLPMLLPCGKNVDQGTLERHNSTEASWGRIPSDPFTGVAYNDKSKPLPNVPLKVRIDKFLLENSDKFSHIPKTLGSNSAGSSSDYTETKVRTSCLVDAERHSKSNENLSGEKSPELNMNRKAHFAYMKKRKISPSSELDGGPCSKYQIKNNPNTFSETFMIHKSKLCNNNTGMKITEEKKLRIDPVSSLKSKTHEEKLKESIDSACSDILSQLPSFVKTNSSVSHVTPVGCSGPLDPGCCICGGPGGSLYSAPCGHLFCRTCVMKKTPGQASGVYDKSCQQTWTSNQIHKVH